MIGLFTLYFVSNQNMLTRCRLLLVKWTLVMNYSKLDDKAMFECISDKALLHLPQIFYVTLKHKCNGPIRIM